MEFQNRKKPNIYQMIDVNDDGTQKSESKKVELKRVVLNNSEEEGTPLSADILNMAFKNIINTIYPVGSVYITFNEANPQVQFGGVWQKINGGHTLICAGVNEGANYKISEYGGYKDATLVKHRHGWANMVVGSNGVNSDGATIQFGYAGSGVKDLAQTIQNGEYLSGNFTIAHSGETGVGKNLPPYVVTNIWKRVE